MQCKERVLIVFVVLNPRLCPPFYTLSSERAPPFMSTTKKPFSFRFMSVTSQSVWGLFDPFVSESVYKNKKIIPHKGRGEGGLKPRVSAVVIQTL